MSGMTMFHGGESRLCLHTFRLSALAAAVLAVALISMTLFAGCSNTASPSEDDEDDGYPLRTSPANAVEKLRLAYVEMDTTAYADCLAGAFEFWLNPDDVNDPGSNLPEYWGYAEEAGIARNMFGSATDILSIQLTLTQIGDPVQIAPPDPGDEPRWEYVYAVYLYVRLPDDWAFLATGASRFTLSVDPDETGRAGETLWEIVKWEDIYPPAGRVETATWGGIKALYR